MYTLPVCIGSAIVLFGGNYYKHNAVSIAEDGTQTNSHSLTKTMRFNLISLFSIYKGRLWVLDNQDYLFFIN